jgi:prolipoprotein diacylglyceryltransferase
MIQNPLSAHAVHALLEAAGMAFGSRLYFARRRRLGEGFLAGPQFAVLLGALVGAGLGNKAVFWIEVPQLWREQGGWPGFFFGGQSMVGGLLGALLGVEAAKALTGVKHSTGDGFVFPILLGLMVGRFGCFLAGLHDDTYGVATGLPWGVDFGDGIARHPTQLYEIAFAALLWRALAQFEAYCAPQPGLLFKLFLAAYLLWRLGVDTLKPVPYAYPSGLSGIQWVCLLALAAYLPLLARQWRKLP